jgi:hypothetical protein
MVGPWSLRLVRALGSGAAVRLFQPTGGTERLWNPRANRFGWTA